MGLFDFLHKGRVDEAAPAVPTEPINQPQMTPSTEFTMQVEDVFTITGRGTVVTGRIQYGTIQVGEKVYINKGIQTEVTGIEMFRKTLDFAQEGDNVGILLRGISRDDIARGDILSK